ncbi:MAG: hypothetical protein MPW14_21640 [Candidatus Manganitrophus sp.]|nr:MAG: hypothetical protein MPW14_21640 [Candidatus Manganitrophus sp.]
MKVPMTANGLKATRRFAKEGIRVNVTLIFSPAQALLAAKAGATYVSPFIGRLDDVGQVGMDLIDQIVTIFRITILRPRSWSPAFEIRSMSSRRPRSGPTSRPCPSLSFNNFSNIRSPTSGWRNSSPIGRRQRDRF